MRPVAIAGIGETPMGKYPTRSVHEMVAQAGNAALLDAGVDRSQVQGLYVGNFNGQALVGQGHIGPLVAETLDLPAVPTIRTEGACASGSLALMLGIQAVQYGIYDIVLVGGVEKMTHRSTATVTEAIASAMDVELEASHGLTFPGSFAMVANRYFHEYRNIKPEMAQVAVNAHHNALLNPTAQMHKAITVEKVLEAAPIADPLGLYDCSLVTDGAAFLVLTTTEIARGLDNGHRIVEVVGTGHGGDRLTLSAKESMTSFAATKQAAAAAFGAAGLGPGDIDFAEVHDCFTITQIINTEDLGFFAPGTGADAVARGDVALDGILPINPSGGLKAKGHPIGATGISQAYEVVTQLRGAAGARQVGRSDIGLTHNLGGTAATCVVNIFKGA